MAIHGDLLLEAWMDPGNPGNPSWYVVRTIVFMFIGTMHMQTFIIFVFISLYFSNLLSLDFSIFAVQG